MGALYSEGYELPAETYAEVMESYEGKEVQEYDNVFFDIDEIKSHIRKEVEEWENMQELTSR